MPFSVLTPRLASLRQHHIISNSNANLGLVARATRPFAAEPYLYGWSSEEGLYEHQLMFWETMVLPLREPQSPCCLLADETQQNQVPKLVCSYPPPCDTPFGFLSFLLGWIDPCLLLQLKQHAVYWLSFLSLISLSCRLQTHYLHLWNPIIINKQKAK